MKKIFLFSCLFFLTSSIFAISKQKIALAGWRITDYSVECMGTGKEGTQLMKVYFYFKKEKEAGLFAKKSAVDAVLFRGIAAGEPGCATQPLVTVDQMNQNDEVCIEINQSSSRDPSDTLVLYKLSVLWKATPYQRMK